MIDELTGSTPYTCQALFHCHPDIEVSMLKTKQVLLTAKTGGAKLVLAPACPDDIDVSWVAGSENPIQGWYSLDHHKKMPVNTVIFEGKRPLPMAFATVLYPLPPHPNAMEIGIEHIDVTDTTAWALRVTTESSTDHIMISQSEELKRFGTFETRARLAVIRSDNNGNILKQCHWPQ